MIKINPEFDKLLGGGLRAGVLTSIYGPPASGKSNMAIIATISASKSGKVIYIDPEGGFSVERVKQIAKNETDAVLKNVLLMEPTTFDEQKVAIGKLDELVPGSNASLVVIDSIAMLYRLEEDKDIKELGRLLAKLLRVARKHRIPVLLLNQVYTDIDSGRVTPVGGIINQYWSKIMIELGVNNENRFAVLRKHLFLKEGAWLDFKITNDGILPLKLSAAH